MIWITFAILIILVTTIPTTMILTKKENPQETSITALTITVTTEKTLTTTEGIVILRGKSSLIFNGGLGKKHLVDIFNSFLFAYLI